MSLSAKILHIFLNTIPIILMIVLIPIIKNDHWLAGLYILIIVVAFLFKHKKNDFLFLFFGLVIMTAAEYLFISTGVETFVRNSFLGIMPIWLPILWGYGFVVIKRSVVILNK